MLTTAEPAEQLGDTTPGALDALPLLEHPACVQASADVRIGPWGWLTIGVAALATLAASSLFPGAWFAGWLP